MLNVQLQFNVVRLLLDFYKSTTLLLLRAIDYISKIFLIFSRENSLLEHHLLYRALILLLVLEILLLIVFSLVLRILAISEVE